MVLVYVSRCPQCTTWEMASAINITERMAHRVLGDLEAGGYIKRQRTGKGNLYQINPDLGLRHALTRDVVVGDLIKVLSNGRRDKPANRFNLASGSEDCASLSSDTKEILEGFSKGGN